MSKFYHDNQRQKIINSVNKFLYFYGEKNTRCTKTQGTNINFNDKYDLENSKPDIREVFFIKIFSMTN